MSLNAIYGPPSQGSYSYKINPTKSTKNPDKFELVKQAIGNQIPQKPISELVESLLDLSRHEISNSKFIDIPKKYTINEIVDYALLDEVTPLNSTPENRATFYIRYNKLVKQLNRLNSWRDDQISTVTNQWKKGLNLEDDGTLGTPKAAPSFTNQIKFKMKLATLLADACNFKKFNDWNDWHKAEHRAVMKAYNQAVEDLEMEFLNCKFINNM